MNFDRLSRFLDSLLDYGTPGCGIPGYNFSLHIGYEEVFRKSGGWADRESGKPTDPAGLYHLYSCTKVVTCATALTLLEEGRFLLTDPVEAYLPEFGNMLVQHRRVDGGVDLRPAQNTMRVIDLFRMSTGLDYNPDCPRFRAALEKAGDTGDTRKVVGAMGAKTLLFEPGTHWMYGLSHDVLGGLICELTGQTLEEAMRERIFEPLGLKDITFSKAVEQQPRYAKLYRFDEEKRRALPDSSPMRIGYGPEYHSGGGGLYSTMEDYSTFLQALANGGVGANGARILSQRTIDLWRMNTLTPEMLKDFNWVQMTGYGYGLGCRTLIDPAKAGALSPVGEFGWGGAAGAYAAIDPKNKISICYIMHMLNSQEPYIQPRLRNLVYAALDE